MVLRGFRSKIIGFFSIIAVWFGIISGLPDIGISLPVDWARYITAAITGIAFVYLFILPEAKEAFLRKQNQEIQQRMTGRVGVEVRPKTNVSVSAKVIAKNPYVNPFSLQDLLNAVSAVVIIGIIIFAFYQIQGSFPPAISQITSNLVLALWILFGGSLIVLLIVLYGFIRELIGS